MRWTTRMWWVSAGLLAAAGCGRGDGQPVEPNANDPAATVEAALDRPFTLRIGQSATIPGTGIALTFRAVQEDSRCPQDATCVWAGNARLDLLGRDATGERSLEVNTTVEPRAATIGGLRLEVVGLEPAPTAGTTVPTEAYRLTLKATSAGSP